MKTLVQMFVLVMTGAATAVLAQQVTPWLSNTLVPIAALAGGALVLALLEVKSAVPLNWWWHRFWYLRDFRRYTQDLVRDDSNVGAESLQTSRLPSVQLLVNSERVPMVVYCTGRLRTQTGDAARLLVLGEPGSGKTFAARRIAHDLAQSAQWRPWRPFPVLAPRLDRYRQGSLEAFLADEVLRATSENSGRVISQALDALMRRGRIVVILDAIDETPEATRANLLAELGNFAKPSRRKVSILITVRSRAILPSEIPVPFEVFDIQPLDDAAVAAFIDLYAVRS